MSRRFQFSLRWLFVAMLAVACFFGGIHFERERKIREEEAAAIVAANGVSAAKAATPIYQPIDIKLPPSITVIQIRNMTGGPKPTSNSSEPTKTRIEALEVRGFEGMEPRPMR
jgi:hypothetical protein